MKKFFLLPLLLISIFILTGCFNNQTMNEEKEPQAGQATTFATLQTNFGDIKIKFYDQDAPKTVENFVTLAQKGYYDGTKFHRVIKDFMIQGGDPNTRSDNWSNHGKGGPGYTIPDEFNQHLVVRGVIAMANTGYPNTGGSQFFIVTAQAAPHLDGKHTVFGEVVDGMEVVEKIEDLKVDPDQNHHPLQDAVIEKVIIEIK